MTNIYAMTGGATGIGAAVKAKLRSRGDTVIVVDLKNADIEADLSTAEGRNTAIEQVKLLSPDGLDGLLTCAGLPPVATPLSLIPKVNYFGSVEVIEGLVDWVAKKSGSIVAVCSNSASMPGLNQAHIQALLNDGEEKACALTDTLDGHNAYAGSKNALALWMRRRAPEYIREKRVRLNAVAPGITATPLTDKVFSDAQLGAVMTEFEKSVPYGEMATPEMIADTMVFLLDPESRFVCGSVLFVDGGHDALLRPDQF